MRLTTLAIGCLLACTATTTHAAERTRVEAAPVVALQSLSGDASDALRRRILVQCGLDEGRDALPWYFHFEYGRALLQAGDARRAVPELARAVDLNPEPRADKRLYGMWFTDYLPYFQLADAHARLGNWPCADEAMRASHARGEVAMGRLDAERVRELQERIDTNLPRAGACHADGSVGRQLADAR